MNLSSCLAEYQVRDYLAFREVIGFCCRRNCDYIEDASCIRIVSKFTGGVWANVPSRFVADSRVDTPHVALLRALVENLDSLGEIDLGLCNDMVSELLGRSAA